ncbi:hypothetical protein D3C85_1404570 [compost metagenome]
MTVGVAGQDDDPRGFPVQAMDDQGVGIAVFLQAGNQAILVVIGAPGHRQQQGRFVDHQDRVILIEDVNIGQRHYVFSANANGDGRARAVKPRPGRRRGRLPVGADQRSGRVMLSSRIEQLPWFSRATCTSSEPMLTYLRITSTSSFCKAGR